MWQLPLILFCYRFFIKSTNFINAQVDTSKGNPINANTMTTPIKVSNYYTYLISYLTRFRTGIIYLYEQLEDQFHFIKPALQNNVRRQLYLEKCTYPLS